MSASTWDKWRAKEPQAQGRKRRKIQMEGCLLLEVTSNTAQRTVGVLPRLQPGLSYQHFIFTLISHSSSLNSPNNKLSFKPPGSLYTCTGMQREFHLSYLFLYSESRMVFSFPSASSRILSQTDRIKDSFWTTELEKETALFSLLSLVSSCSNLYFSLFLQVHCHENSDPFMTILFIIIEAKPLLSVLDFLCENAFKMTEKSFAYKAKINCFMIYKKTITHKDWWFIMERLSTLIVSNCIHISST